MDYESMWNELKAEIKTDLRYYRSGSMQSISESVQGEIKCMEILSYMENIEEKYMESIEENLHKNEVLSGE